MAAKPVNILVTGDVKGNCNSLFAKVEGLLKKTKFDMLFCVGDFFGEDDGEWNEYATGRKRVPVTTYILGPCEVSCAHNFTNTEGHELCDNVTFLGRKGMFSASSGLQVAYLSGLDGRDIGDSTHFCHTDVQSLKWSTASDAKFVGVDILLTSAWPKQVDKYATQVGKQLKEASAAVAQLALALRPRYHFAGYENVHYERHPYRNHRVAVDAARHVTRFIALATVGNAEKHKFLYGASVVPMSLMKQELLIVQPEDTTECPYKVDLDLIPDGRANAEDKAGAVQYFYSTGNSRGGGGQKRKPDGNSAAGVPSKRPPPQPTGPCWFCLGSAEVEKQLVVSVGSQVYLALAKGGLVSDHLLILPIGHYQSHVATPDDVLAEVTNYKRSIELCFRAAGKAVVFFERNFKSAHLQVQVVPFDLSLVSRCQEAFCGAASTSNLELNELPANSDLKQILQPGTPYFYVELPTGKKYLHRIKKTFPLQFGREVMASPKLLNMPDRVDWRACAYSKEEELKMASDFRKQFNDFDCAKK